MGRRKSQDLYGGFLDGEDEDEDDDGEIRVPMDSINLETHFACGAYFALAGSPRTVPRSELYAIVILVFLQNLGRSWR